jgi:hypothetical protein
MLLKSKLDGLPVRKSVNDRLATGCDLLGPFSGGHDVPAAAIRIVDVPRQVAKLLPCRLDIDIGNVRRLEVLNISISGQVAGQTSDALDV